MKVMAAFCCSACGHKYTIVENPASEEELIARFILRERRCRICNAQLGAEQRNVV